jgi:hypothetical protein
MYIFNLFNFFFPQKEAKPPAVDSRYNVGAFTCKSRLTKAGLKQNGELLPSRHKRTEERKWHVPLQCELMNTFKGNIG